MPVPNHTLLHGGTCQPSFQKCAATSFRISAVRGLTKLRLANLYIQCTPTLESAGAIYTEHVTWRPGETPSGLPVLDVTGRGLYQKP
jgi:hypothetical protein